MTEKDSKAAAARRLPLHAVRNAIQELSKAREALAPGTPYEKHGAGPFAVDALQAARGEVPDAIAALRIGGEVPKNDVQ